MFTTGQLVFSALFFVAFVLIIFFSYRGDKKLHKKHYNGSLWVLVGFIAFLALLIIVKTYYNA